MNNSGWYGDEIRHSLVKRGVRGLKKDSLSKINDVDGLDRLVDSYVTKSGVPFEEAEAANHAVKLGDWKFVIDSSRDPERYFGKLTVKQERAAKARAPGFSLGFDPKTDEAYVFVGKGGEFTHPAPRKDGKAYKDNQYLEPIAYSGQSIVLPKTITLYAQIRENGTGVPVEVPYNIRGLVGTESKVGNYMPAKQRQLAGVA